MISESVSDLEKSGGSAPSICIDVLALVIVSAIEYSNSTAEIKDVVC